MASAEMTRLYNIKTQIEARIQERAEAGSSEATFGESTSSVTVRTFTIQQLQRQLDRVNFDIAKQALEENGGSVLDMRVKKIQPRRFPYYW